MEYLFCFWNQQEKYCEKGNYIVAATLMGNKARKATMIETSEPTLETLFGYIAYML